MDGSPMQSPGRSVLKSKSSFDADNKVRNKGSNIAFADEKGQTLVENNYSEQLYYSTSSVRGGQGTQGQGCCTIS
jgi:hypothetical protein